MDQKQQIEAVAATDTSTEDAHGSPAGVSTEEGCSMGDQSPEVMAREEALDRGIREMLGRGR